jgi:uncharacterized protein (TIGR03032 family)
MSQSSSSAPPDDYLPENWRKVRFRHSPSFVDILGELGCSLLVSTYQAGKLVAIGVVDDALEFSFHSVEQAMGIAVSPQRIAVGTKGHIWFFQNNSQLAPSIAPAGKYDGCYLARTAHATGGIHCHEMAWGGQLAEELWVVNTLFSCLATLHDDFSFVPRWRPPFITELAGEDRCHLNGLAMQDGRPRYVTLMAASNQPAGWRPTKSTTGAIFDVVSNQPITHGLAMPHSPRWYGERLWVLNSGFGALESVDLATGRRVVVAHMPGYTRGLSFCGPFAFVGLSRIRETAVFGGVPIAEHKDQLRCGIGVVDLRSGRPVASLEFETGVEEIFEVQVLPNVRCAALCGPRPDQDGAQDIWLVPPPEQVPMIVARQEARSLSGSASGFRLDASVTEEQFRTLLAGAQLLQRERRLADALAMFEKAVSLQPGSAEAWNHYGNALQDAGRQEQALECYRKAVAADPSFGPAVQNLGYVLVAQGRTDEGVVHLKEAQRAQPADINRALIATALPVIYESVEDLVRRRRRLVEGVQQLVDQQVTIDTADTLVPTNFFAAYQGENDRELHANLGRIYRGHSVLEQSAARAGGRPRIGFLSAYFRDHTIGRLNLGRIERLSHDKFEVVVLSVGKHDDPLAESFRRAADRFVAVPREVAAARRLIAEQQLDLLLFTDVGMDALTYTLAFSRMAPVQVATWGHPVTTGSPMMDYFLSSKLLEIPEAQAHYTEKLVKLPNFGTYYYRPQLVAPLKTRAQLGLPADKHLYACPQTLFKFHPAFDEVLGEILRRDPQGELVLIEGRTAYWTRLLKERFERSIPDVASRIRFLPPLANSNFLQLLARVDVLLDPPQFGGGNTSYEALAVGTPVVTLPGELMRSRITQALYKKMDYLELVTDSPEAYMAKAVELGTDSRAREAATSGIIASSDVLFEDGTEVEELGQFLWKACDQPLS